MTITWKNEKRKLRDLIPWQRNPRVIKRKQAGLLAESVSDFGQVETLAIGPANELYNGHQRLQVLADQYGPDLVVDVRVASRALSEKEREKLTILLHKGAAGEFDMDILANEFDMEDLLAWGFEEFELGLGADEVEDDQPTGTEDTPAELDRADELGAKWGTAEGQIWRVGDHYMICGDCRDPQTWHRLLRAAQVNKINGVFTSPPYAQQRKDQYGGVDVNQYVEWWHDLQANVQRHLMPDGTFFVNIKAHCEDGQRVLYCMDLVLAMVRRWGWLFIDENAWIHQGFPGEPQRRFQNAWEPIYCFSRSNPKFRPDNVAYDSDAVIHYEAGLNLRQKQRSTAALTAQSDIKHGAGKAYPRNVLKISTASANVPEHAAAYPVALPDFFIRAYSDPGDVWLDPFLGSGTTIIAAHNNQRIGLGSERLPKYMGVILERLQDHMETQPELLTGTD